MTHCFHCGDPCKDEDIKIDDKSFCCTGCKTVYEILHDSDMSYYYDIQKNPGISPGASEGKFDFLANENIAEKLLEFNDTNMAVVSFSIPSIHCSSCIWILENLNKINPAIKSSQVNFPKKTARITFAPDTSPDEKRISLKELAVILSRIGYEPYISLEDSDKKEVKTDRSLIYKIAVAGFAFGNIMFLSLPEYFQSTEYLLDKFRPFFRWLIFGFSLPVTFYSATGYFKSAYKGLRSGILNIDVPLALGIAALFIQSTVDIVFGFGTGYFDSLAGLVFFLLLGKFFQQRTYSYLSFERDYKSYFPLAVTLLTKNGNEISEEQIEVGNIQKGDRLLIKNNEIIPVDAVLIKGNALIDYSFVTGEADPVPKNDGDKLFAGGKQQAGIIEVEAIKPVEQSYLTQLWSNAAFKEENHLLFKTLTDKISKHFTLAILLISFLSTAIWLMLDSSKAFFVFSAVLIVACPCAIALAAPFTLGNALRIFGRKKLYLKESTVIEKMAQVDTLVFDKTGTLTTSQKNVVTYEGIELTDEEQKLLTGALRASNHPLSRSLYDILKTNNIEFLSDFKEEAGKGISAVRDNQFIKVGSYNYVNSSKGNQSTQNNLTPNQTAVHISLNEEYKGCYVFNSEYREGVSEVFKNLSGDYDLYILSGDNEGEREVLTQMLPEGVQMKFNQKPDDKLRFIKNLQDQGKKILMIGDGLNDAGALKQSDVGVVISENTNFFTPACDGILDAAEFRDIPKQLWFCKKSTRIIRQAFLFSLFYNIIGISFAVTGNLQPVIAAILMPLSSISIVAFTTFATRWAGSKWL